MITPQAPTPIMARLRELERDTAWLARKANVDTSTAWRWATGRTALPDHRIETVAEILEMDPTDVRPAPDEVAA